MARWKKPKVKPQRERSSKWCQLCLKDLTEEEVWDSWVFLTHRPCTIPGWQSLAVAGVWDMDTLPVVWGVAISVACPDCWANKVPDYLAGIELLMENEETQPAENIRSRRPLTLEEVEDMLEGVAADREHRVMVGTGLWFDEEDAEALGNWETKTWGQIQTDADKAAKSEGDG